MMFLSKDIANPYIFKHDIFIRMKNTTNRVQALSELILNYHCRTNKNRAISLPVEEGYALVKNDRYD